MELCKEIEQAHLRIRNAILRTPLIYSDAFSRLTSLIAQHHANILHIIHERAPKEIPTWVLEDHLGSGNARSAAH